jgi:hypothetical protein
MFGGDKELAKAAAIIAVGFEKIARRLREQGRIVDLGQNDTPYIVGKRGSGRRGDNMNRGRVRAIASMTHKLFGSYLYDVVAKIATVALQSNISERSVRNWCTDLSVAPANNALP